MTARADSAAEIAVEPPKVTAASARQARRDREAAAKRAVAIAAPERPGLHPDQLRTRAVPPLDGGCLECDKRRIAAWLLGGHFAGGCTHGGTR